MGSAIATIVVIVLILVLVIRCICIVPQANAWVIETLGRYKDTWNAGLHFKVPVIDKVIKLVDRDNKTLTLECPEGLIDLYLDED